MKKAKFSKEVQNELPKTNESSEEILDFSELSSITGGKDESKDTGCSAVFSGNCSGGKDDDEAESFVG